MSYQAFVCVIMHLSIWFVSCKLQFDSTLNATYTAYDTDILQFRLLIIPHTFHTHISLRGKRQPAASERDATHPQEISC